MNSRQRLNKLLDSLGLDPKGARYSMARRIVDRKTGETLFEGVERDVWQWLRDTHRHPTERERSPRQKLTQAMRNSEHWACRIVYLDRKGNFTVRIVSPTKYVNDDKTVETLCIGREEPRCFIVSQIQSVELIPAAQVQMGMEPVLEVSFD